MNLWLGKVENWKRIEKWIALTLIYGKNWTVVGIQQVWQHLWMLNVLVNSFDTVSFNTRLGPPQSLVFEFFNYAQLWGGCEKSSSRFRLLSHKVQVGPETIWQCCFKSSWQLSVGNVCACGNVIATNSLTRDSCPCELSLKVVRLTEWDPHCVSNISLCIHRGCQLSSTASYSELLHGVHSLKYASIYTTPLQWSRMWEWNLMPLPHNQHLSLCGEY